MKVKDLKPAEYNPRVISAARLKMLKKSLDAFGDLSGIVFNAETGNLVGGHQRLKHLEPEWEIVKEPCADDTGTVALGYVDTPTGRLVYREVRWPLEKEIQANIAANQHGGAFEEEGLVKLFRQIGQQQDADLIGFEQSEFDRFFRKSAAERNRDLIENVLPETTGGPRTKAGDVWLLGGHKIICGDCTNAEVVTHLLAGTVPHLMVTDPPMVLSMTPLGGPGQG